MNSYKIKRGKLWQDGKRYVPNDIVTIPEYLADKFGRSNLELVPDTHLNSKNEKEVLETVKAKVRASKLVTNPAAPTKDEKGLEVIEATKEQDAPVEDRTVTAVASTNKAPRVGRKRGGSTVRG